MKPSVPLAAALSATVALVALVPAASAHATAYDTGSSSSFHVRFVYGNLYEPVSTFQKTGLDLGVFDAKGTPITGLDAIDHDNKPVANPPVHVTLTYAGQTLDMTPGFKAQFGKPGWYSFPLIYTQPGAYVLHVQGTINGTAVNMDIQPAHPIGDSSSEMFPAKVATPDQMAKDIADLKAQVAALQASGSGSKGSPATDGITLAIGLLGLAAVVAARRSA